MLRTPYFGTFGFYYRRRTIDMDHPEPRSWLLFRSRRDEWVIGILRRYLAEYPDDLDARARLAAALDRQGRRTEARGLLKSGPLSALGHFVKGCLALKRGFGRFERARRSFRAASEQEPHNVDYLSCYAAFECVYRPKHALEIAERGLAIDPLHLGCLNTKASALRRCHRRAEAASILEFALNIDPSSQPTYENLALAALEIKDYPAAASRYKEALEHCSDNSNAAKGLMDVERRIRFELRSIRAALWLGLARIESCSQGIDPSPSVEPRWSGAIFAGCVIEATLVAVYGLPGVVILTLLAFWPILALLYRQRSVSAGFGVVVRRAAGILMLGWCWRACTLNTLLTPNGGRFEWILATVLLFSSLWIFLFVAVAMMPKPLADWSARRILEDRAARRRKRHTRGDG